MIHEIFLDLQKAYDDLDRERFLGILDTYSVGPMTLWILRSKWVWMKMVARSGGYYGPPFKGYQRLTQ